VDDSAKGDGEIFEATIFLHHFKDLTDTRQQTKVVYPLDEVLLLALLATLAGAESFTDIARFGEKATSSRHSMPNSSSAVSSPGSRQ
jgi:DDE_Tnp_1-associated